MAQVTVRREGGKSLSAEDREMARNMLLGHHRVSYTASHLGVADSVILPIAEKLLAERRIPKVRP